MRFFHFRTEIWNEAMFVYSLVEKTWRKIDIRLSKLVPENDSDYDRITEKMMYLENSMLFLFITKGKQRILLCRNIDSDEYEWELKFANEQEQNIENIRPFWTTCKILTIYDEKITF
jgi:hypothetical protein